MTDFQQQPRPDDAVLGGTQTGAQSKISREKRLSYFNLEKRARRLGISSLQGKMFTQYWMT
ncbi:hypothetical protein IQ218_17815 [Synechocystis salina LEGE 06099]|uniref:hypothetical protein n=1 Tax=Synechocystis salina TaxID=945780 RepID=UPI00188171A5|nr:hypothetical protein [Synechocystis salina]MBE9204935.1 hypothetical protein [Synechocystis salina LEGE 06099]